ncbi:reverse transcriptase domain-containing protein [Tanacetum coccineum]
MLSCLHTRMIDTRPYGTTAYNYTRYPDTLPYVYTRGYATPRFSTLPPPLSSYPTSRRTARMSVIPVIELDLAKRARIASFNLDDYQDDPESPPPSPLSPYLFDLGLVEGIVLVLEYVVGWWMLGNWGVGEDLVVDIGGGGIGAIRWGLRGVVKGMEGLGGLEGVDVVNSLTKWDVKPRVKIDQWETLLEDPINELITQFIQVCKDVEIYARDAQEEASEMRLEALDNVVQQICPEALAAAAMTHATSTQEETNLRSNTSQNKACTYNEFRAVMQGNFRSDRVKFASSTLLDSALTWWNVYVHSATLNAAHITPWNDFKVIFIKKYFPRNEVKQMENKLWNLKVKGTNLTTYNQHFQELILLCPEMVPNTDRLLERYIEGYLEHQETVTSSKLVDIHEVAFDHLRDALSVIFGLSVTQDTVMSDSEDSTVTYTQISSPFVDLSDIGSPGVDGPPIMPDDPYAYVVAAFQAPPSPDYVPGPEEPQAPLPLDFVPEPVYPEFMPPDDEVLPAEEQPLPAAASPTDQSPGYIPESDPDEDLEEDDEDPEEDPVDYPADRDDDEEEEEEPSGDEADDEDEDEDEDEEEEKHPAPADSVPPIHRITARISIRDEPSISLPPREEVERLLALTTLPSSPLTPLPLPLPHIPSLPLLPIPVPISLPHVLLPSTDRRADRPEFCLPPRKRLCSTQGPRTAG